MSIPPPYTDPKKNLWEGSYPKKKKMNTALKIILWAVGIFIVIGIIAVASGSDEKEPALKNEPIIETPEEIPAISSGKLYQEYEANEIAADKKYKGVKLKVNGRVESIGKDILNDPYITLYSGSEAFYVQGYLENEDAASTLKKGDIISLVGTCDGMAVLNVILKDCIIE